MKNLIVFVSFVLVSGSMSACGNLNGSATNVNQANSLSANSSNYSAAAQSCSSTPNVNSQGYTSSNSYYGCSTGSSYGGAELFSADSQDHQVCVFPVRIIGSQTATFTNNPSGPWATRFVNQCITVGATGNTINFGTLSFNAVFVVDAVNVANFSACIQYGDISTCAAQSGIGYSFGQIK
jgi:hypothetical protein